MGSTPETASLEKNSESHHRETPGKPAVLASFGDPFHAVADRMLLGPTDPPDVTIRSLRAPALRVPVLQHAQRAWGNHASQQIVQRACGLQRQCACGGTCPKCRENEQRPLLQRSPANDDERAFNGLPSTAGAPLEARARRSMENHFDTDLTEVRVHTAAEDAASATALEALAYTSGRDIYFAAGMYAPSTTAGQRLLTHEVAHVMQQRSGREPSLSTKSAHGVKVGAPDDALEAAADSASEQFVNGTHETDETPSERLEAKTAIQPFVQRQPASKTTGEELPISGELELRTYRVNLGGQQFSLTPTEYDMLLKATAREIARKARSYKDTAETLLETQQQHIKDSNSVIRYLSSLVGGADLPDADVYTQPAKDAEALIADVQRIDINPENGQRIEFLYQRLSYLAQETKAAEHAWYKYINGTIEGAESTVHGLETVRDTAFAVDAALAGGVAAPAIFTAAGGGVVGTSLALGGGAVAGSGTKGLLEFGGAAGGEALSTAITPGSHSFDWSYVEQRTTKGLKSGTFEGALGAGAAFITPAVSGVMTRGVTSVGGEAFATSTAGRYTISALTGITMGGGAPALTNAPALAHGDISTGDYFWGIGKGAFWGGAAGMASNSIQGLNREGGIPFRGDVAPMPRWMFAGPLSPLAPGWNPTPGFNQLPFEELPKIPGMTWTRVTYQGQPRWEPMSTLGAARDPVQLNWYGDPNVSSANFVIRVGGTTTFGIQTFSPTPYTGLPANTGAGGTSLPGAPSSMRDDFPVTSRDFTEPATGQTYTRGHIIDFRNTTPRTASIPDSNMDPANFTPEQPWIGGGRLPGGGRTFGVRAQITNRIIRTNPGGGARLAQYNVSTSGRTTLNGELIPDEYIYVERNAAGIPTRAWRIPNNTAAPPSVPGPAGGPPGRPVTSAGDADAAFDLPLNQIPRPILDHLRIEALTAAAVGEAVGKVRE